MNPMNVQLDIGGVWRLSIFIGLIFCTFSIWKKCKSFFGWQIALLWSYVIASALCILEFPFVRFGDYQTAFMANAGQTLAEAVLLPLVILLMSMKGLERLYKFLVLMIVFEIAAVWFHGCGFMMQTSFDSALIALFMPFAPPVLWAISLVTVLTHHGSTALLIILSQCAIWAIRKYRIGTLSGLRFAIAGALGTALIWSVARFHNADIMLNGSERLMAYKRFLAFWWDQGIETRLFGVGAGTFGWFGMLIDNFQEPHFVQMHSDWLQIIFELGIFGLLITIAVLVKTTKAAWNNPHRLCSIFGLAAFMVTYHPLRFFPSMLLAAYIVRMGLISCK